MIASKLPLLTDPQVRTKLTNQGVDTLTDAELLSILIKEGTETRSALEMAQALLGHYDNNLYRLGKSGLNELRMTENLGLNRAANILSAIELGRRLRIQEAARQEHIRTSRDVIGIFQPYMAPLRHEEFWALFLNSSNNIVDKVLISRGGVEGTVVDYRLILKAALNCLATGIIAVHNHPSGNCEPSPEDLLLTRKLTEGAALFDILIADHVIVTSGTCYSFRENGFFS